MIGLKPAPVGAGGELGAFGSSCKAPVIDIAEAASAAPVAAAGATKSIADGVSGLEASGVTGATGETAGAVACGSMVNAVAPVAGVKESCALATGACA